MTIRQLSTCIKKLNLIFNLNVKLRTHPEGCQLFGNHGPFADIWKNKRIIVLPRHPVFYNSHVIAHEYAHMFRLLKHDELFEATYRECCLHLGIWPIPTKTLVSLVKTQYGLKVGEDYREKCYALRQKEIQSIEEAAP